MPAAVATRARAKPRRTQEQRRSGTIKKLIDAATEILIEEGYAGATVQLISDRAGVSQGGLFRHFPTREALMVAVGEDVSVKILERYKREFAALGAQEDPALQAVKLLQGACRSRINQAWLELSHACRTSPGLQRALRPLSERYDRDISALARELLPELAERLDDYFPVLVDTMVAIFDGEQLHRFVHKQPELEEKRLQMLGLLTRLLLVAPAESRLLPGS